MTEDEIAPTLFALFVNNPQINGPRKTDPMAPQEIPRIATIVSGLMNASITEINTKAAFENRINIIKP